MLKMNLLTGSAKKKEFDNLIESYRGKGDYDCIVPFSGGKVMTNINPVKLSKKAEEFGAGEILLTSIDNDGMYNGLDIEMISIISKSVSIPVIASGDCGTAKHISDGFFNW